MNQYVRLPDPLCETGDMARNWRKWKNDFVIFMKAGNNINASMETKIFLLKNYIGKFGEDIIEKIIGSNFKCQNNIDILLLELDKHFETSKNEIAERYRFFTAYKGRNKSFGEYIDYLKDKAATCNFETMRDSLIRDKIIADLKDEQLVKKLISVENLDLSRLASICSMHARENEQKKQASLADNVNKCIPNIEGNMYSHTRRTHTRNCRHCDQRHPIRACPAWRNKCSKCGLYNHYVRCCPNTTISDKREEEKSMNLQQENVQIPSAPPFFTIENNDKLYPSLKDVKGLEEKTSIKPRTWNENRNKKLNENLQTTSATFQERIRIKPAKQIAESDNNNCCIS